MRRRHRPRPRVSGSPIRPATIAARCPRRAHGGCGATAALATWAAATPCPLSPPPPTGPVCAPTQRVARSTTSVRCTLLASRPVRLCPRSSTACRPRSPGDASRRWVRRASRHVGGRRSHVYTVRSTPTQPRLLLRGPSLTGRSAAALATRPWSACRLCGYPPFEAVDGDLSELYHAIQRGVTFPPEEWGAISASGAWRRADGRADETALGLGMGCGPSQIQRVHFARPSRCALCRRPAKEFVAALLSTDPEKRLSTRGALHHAWFKVRCPLHSASRPR